MALAGNPRNDARWAKKALLLTGPPGCGKTTLILRAAERLGERAGGFYTTEVRQSGKRVGFNIVTLDGARATLSHVTLSSPHQVGRYGVDVEALERVGVAALRKAARSRLVVVVDEIGKSSTGVSQPVRWAATSFWVWPGFLPPTLPRCEQPGKRTIRSEADAGRSPARGRRVARSP